MSAVAPANLVLIGDTLEIQYFYPNLGSAITIASDDNIHRLGTPRRPFYFGDLLATFSANQVVLSQNIDLGEHNPAALLEL